MPRLKWDQTGEKTYETGVDRCVLYPQKNGQYMNGVAWNGVTSISETPSGGEDNPLYADNIKYLNLKSAEDFGATIECYTYPDEWADCNGEADLLPGVTLSQQRRNTFGLSYRTMYGNDTDGTDHGYKIHLIYGCSASPSERAYETINESPSAIAFSYEIATTPVTVSATDEDGRGFKPTSLVVIDSTRISVEKMKALEDVLYGTEGAEGTVARLPFPDELVEILAAG